MSESEARAQGRKIRVARMPMSSVARALEVDESRGFMKAIVDAGTGQILGATVLGIASLPHHEWLVAHDVIPVPYGEGLAERLLAAAPSGIDAFIDLFGPQYVQLAVDLGVARDRIETIISRDKAQELGTKAVGSGDASTTEVLSQMAKLVASGQIEIPIAATYELEEVRAAFAELEQRHTHGKIVLVP